MHARRTPRDRHATHTHTPRDRDVTHTRYAHATRARCALATLALRARNSQQLPDPPAIVPGSMDLPACRRSG